MKILKLVLVWAGVGLFLAAPALGDDLNPPPWRGEWSTTSQIWEFMAPLQPPVMLPPDGPAAGGQPPLPSTQIWVAGNDWLPTDPYGSDREGIYHLSGLAQVTVDNHEPPNDWKWVWLQITWRGMDGGTPILCALNPAPLPGDEPRIVSERELDFGWISTTWEWFLRPNPPDEFFAISGNVLLDQVVIDTWCMPEPASLGLLVLGSLALLRRRGA